MSTFTNTVAGSSLDDALGNPASFTAADEVILNQAGDTYNTGLGNLPLTQIAKFQATPAFKGDIGNREAAETIQADNMILNAKSPRFVSLNGLGSGTVVLFDWEMLTAAVGNLTNYTITKLRMLSGGLLDIKGTTVVTNAYLGTRGASAVFRAGTAMTLLTVAMGCKATLERDCATVKNYGGIVECNDPTATPATIECIGGSINHLGGIVAITAGNGAIIDLSKATADLTITWSIVGDVTIIAPPEGIAWNEPTDAQILRGKVTIRSVKTPHSEDPPQ